MSLHVLLSQSSDFPSSKLGHTMVQGGFTVVEHALGSTPAVEFESCQAAVIDVAGKIDHAVAQTKRWRAELGDELFPIVWVLPGPSPELAERGLDAGADVVLSHPLEESVLLAQIRAVSRMRATGLRVSARAAEARLLGEQLQKTYRQIDGELDSARRIQRAFLPHTLPVQGAARFAVSHRARNRIIGDFYDVRVLDEEHIGFFLGDVVGSGGAGSLTGIFAAQAVAMKKLEGSEYKLALPGEVLSQVNRELLGLGLEESPLVAMLVATLHTKTGQLLLARAGLPTPIYVPKEGKPQPLVFPGPFLGTADASYPTIPTILRTGDRLVIGTDGIRPEGNPAPRNEDELLEAISRHQSKSGQGFVDAIASDLLAKVRHSDDFTLLSVEMTAG